MADLYENIGVERQRRDVAAAGSTSRLVVAVAAMPCDAGQVSGQGSSLGSVRREWWKFGAREGVG